MSAFIVSKRHIDFLLTYGMKRNTYGDLGWLAPAERNPETFERGVAIPEASVVECARRRRTLNSDTADGVGSMLWGQNRKSVNHRYDEEEGEEFYVFKRLNVETITPVQVLKQIDCYVYQSCEHPEWEASEARAFCEALRHRAINALPGYDAAPWGIDR